MMGSMILMAKTPEKRKAGRPSADRPKSILVSFRIDERTAAALEEKRSKSGIISFSVSDMAREMILRDLKAEGLL